MPPTALRRYFISMNFAICNIDSIAGYVRGKSVLVTGGGGSIGSELCRQIAAHNPRMLIIFDIYENNAYDIQQELKKKYPKMSVANVYYMDNIEKLQKNVAAEINTGT